MKWKDLYEKVKNIKVDCLIDDSKYNETGEFAIFYKGMVFMCPDGAIVDVVKYPNMPEYKILFAQNRTPTQMWQIMRGLK